MKMFAVSVILLLLTGCMAGMPNHVTSNTSNFDGAKSLSMQPGFIYESMDTFAGGPFQLGLFWSEKYKDIIVITAKLPMEITNIQSNNGLLFNIDGKITKLSSPKLFTKFQTIRTSNTISSDSVKDFAATTQFIEKLINAKSVKVKLVTSKGVLTGDLKADKPSAAIRGFKDFMQQLKTN